jgi:hypothetical protein
MMVGFLAFGKDGVVELVRPDLAFAACCRAERRLDLVGLYGSAFTFPADEFPRHFAVHRRRGWAGPCGTLRLFWDQDGPDATRDTRRLAAYLIDHYVLDEGQILVGFSGEKGYHIELAFGPVQPADRVPASVRRLCTSVAAAIGIDSFDAGNYDRTRLWRCWNSRHEKTGRFKRRLGLDELLYLDQDRHADLAREPFAFDPPDPSRSPALAADWARALADEPTASARPRASVADAAGPPGGGLTDAAWTFLSGAATRPGRHVACVHAAAALARAGCPRGLAWDLLWRAAGACGLVEDYARGDVRRAIENGWRLGRAQAPRPAAGGHENARPEPIPE